MMMIVLMITMMVVMLTMMLAPRRRCPAGPSCCGAGLLSPGTVPCTAKNFVQELCLVRMQNVYDQSSGTLSGWVM